MPAFAQNLSAMPTRAKVILGVSVVGVLLVIFMLLRLASAPSYATLMTGLDPADTGKITTVLDEAAIPYELQSGGTALAVQKADTAKARIALAGEGLGGSSGDMPGFELFDTQKLGASDRQQQVTYLRALQGEVTKTVNGVDGVSEAKVQIVMPEDDLFADEASPATAAVALGNPGDALEPGAVKGIAQLVSSSVKGLKPNAVTITDSAGQVLWPTGDGAAGGSGGSTKQAAEARYASQQEASLQAMLDRTLGAGKAMVQVQADLNMDKTVRNELSYGRRPVPQTTETETERLRGTGGRAGGTAGTAGNIPTYGAGGGGSGNSNYQREKTAETNALDKTVSKTDVAQGAVNRLNVALVLDQSVTGGAAGANGAAQKRADIQNAVATAAGVDTARGDTISTTELPFAKEDVPVAKESPVPAGIIAQAKWAALGLAALLFCFFMLRHLRRREREELPHPAWLSEIDQPVSLAALESGEPTRIMSALPNREVDPGLERLEQLMDREPERVAAQVRAWMTEE